MANNKFKGEGIFSAGYGMIPKQIMNDPDLTIEAKAIYAYLASYSGAGDTAYPSVDRMCSKLKISRSRFYKHRKLLEDKGYITITQKRDDAGWDNNVYHLPVNPISSDLCTQNEYARNQHTQNQHTQNDYTNNNSPTNNNSSINNNEHNNDHLPKKSKEKHSANFERFWGIYPKKVAKQKAKDIWLQKKYDDLLTEKIIDAITQQVEVTWKGTEKQYIPNATTWLNQQRWEDEIIKSPPPQNNRRTPAQSERERIKDPSEYDHPTNANAYARAWFEKQQALAAQGGEDHA